LASSGTMLCRRRRKSCDSRLRVGANQVDGIELAPLAAEENARAEEEAAKLFAEIEERWDQS